MPSMALAILRGGAFDDPEFRRETPTGALRAMMAKRRREFKAITKKLADGLITPVEWADLFEAILLEGHTQAAHLGRILADGEQSKESIDDLLRGTAATDEERFFLHGFKDALEALDSRYWDAENQVWLEDAITDRQANYLPKMRGTANSAWLDESPADASITWHDSDGPDECNDCHDYADLSPYTKDELPTVPGACRTPCLYNCNCWLTIDGVTGFKPVKF